MLQVNGQIINVDDYCITYDYDGNEYLDFDINTGDSVYKQITERVLIHSESNNYLVTKIDGSSGRYVHVSAEVDRRAFQAVFYENYNGGSKQLTQAVSAFLPSGWTFTNNGNTTSYRTLKLEYGTALDLLENCAALYKVCFKFDAQTKTLTAINPESYTQSAAFVTEELNLKALQYYGDASQFITRLEARGKDGLTFNGATIDGQTINKTYVENYTYSTDVVYGYWKDERYTVKEDLYQAATEKLAELCVPQRSYECNVIDLKSIDPDKYTAFDLSLYQRIALKDVSRETSYVYQVVKVVNYPNYPEKNIITLSTTAPKLTTKLQDIETEIKDFNETVSGSTSWLTNADGGYIYFIRDNDGNITSFVLKVGEGNNPPVWVFNKNGIGYSADGISGTPSIAMKADGEIIATSGTVGGWHIGQNSLWSGSDVEHRTMTLWSNTSYFDLGLLRLFGNVQDNPDSCPYLESLATNGDIMLVTGNLATSCIAFGVPVTGGMNVTSRLYPDYDGNGHSKLQVNYIELSSDGLRALKTALAGV